MKNLILLIIAGLVATDTMSQSSDSSIFFYDKGMIEKNARRYREAEKNFTKSFQLDPKNLENLLQLASSLMEQHRYADAADKYQKAEGIDANNPIVIENLANLSFNTRKYEDAIRYATKMLQQKIGTGNNFLIARSYYELENYGEAIRFCERAFKEDATNAQIPYIAGRSFMDLHNYKRAAGCFDQALALDSTNTTWMYEAGLVWYAVPDDKKALYWMEKAGEKGYTKSNDYMENLASAYLNVGNYEKGIGILEEILKRKPQDQELLFNIGDAYYKIKKYPQAIEYWDQILVIDSKNATALYMMGMAFQKKGETQKGEQLCDKAIQMDPSLKKLKEEKKMPGGL
ncbi:MAG: tetratricopeptide repeat protein [Chitinophagaceae bacterium]